MENKTKDLERLDTSLTQLKKNFNEQLYSLDTDINEFHKQLIDLSTKYPENKELLEFIVFINDKMETSHTTMRDVIADAINEFIDIKKKHIEDHIDYRLSEITHKRSKIFDFKNIKFSDIKIVLFLIAGILALVAILVSPETLMKVFEYISNIHKI